MVFKLYRSKIHAYGSDLRTSHLLSGGGLINLGDGEGDFFFWRPTEVGRKLKILETRDGVIYFVRQMKVGSEFFHHTSEQKCLSFCGDRHLICTSN